MKTSMFLLAFALVAGFASAYSCRCDRSNGGDIQFQATQSCCRKVGGSLHQDGYGCVMRDGDMTANYRNCCWRTAVGERCW
ncbi:uncharacterized protein VTP21DRAFT_3153 [Calcarisporiella thermophila]|uniref:uncharacterized protein n=1 Tax=Calcarisporiella thermophila TaxID=911321 RepID=UPI003744A04B